MTAFVGANLTNTYTLAELQTSGAGFSVGERYIDNDGKEYRFVKYNTAAGVIAAVANNFCYYYAAGGVSAGAVTEVTSDLSDSAGVGAGMLMAVIANGSYGWIQTRGSATLTTALTAGADGNALTPVGSTDGTLDVSALVTDHICAIAVDASAKIVFITCP
jgi:site-specific recombinase